MIGEGQFGAQVNSSWAFLKSIGLAHVRRSSDDLSEEDYRLLRRSTYFEEWKYLTREGHFDFQLVDTSLFLFQRTDEELRYCYYDSAVEVQRYDEFLTSMLGDGSLEIAGFSLWEAYEEEVYSGRKRDLPNPVRYDYSPDQYRPGAHPASHLHVSPNGEMRLGVANIFGPLAFTYFVVRQFFVREWENFIERADSASRKSIRRAIREDACVIPQELWREEDELESYLA